MVNAQHSSESNLWYTPVKYIEAARSVLGTIDLDPASDRQANETIKALNYFAECDESLDREWHGRVWLNPPGGRGMPKRFWGKLVQEYVEERVTEAIFACFSVEQLSSFQSCSVNPLDFPVCFPSKRVRWNKPEGKASSPTHAAAFVYLGPNEDRFRAIFGAFGVVTR